MDYGSGEATKGDEHGAKRQVQHLHTGRALGKDGLVERCPIRMEAADIDEHVDAHRVHQAGYLVCLSHSRSWRI